MKRWQGLADTPLSDLGEQQAAAAASSLPHADAIVTSPLERARRTGDIIAEHLRLTDVSTIYDLRERSVGEWQGLNEAEIEKEWPGYLAARKRPPSWERDEDVRLRGKRALLDIAHRYPGLTVIVVSHGGLIGSIDRMLNAFSIGYDNLQGRTYIVRDGEISVGDRISPIPQNLLSEKTAVL